MMQPDQNFPPSSSWPNFNSFINSTIDQFEPYGLNMGVHFEGCDEFSSSFTTRENSSEISTIMFSNEIFPYISACSDQFVPLEDFPVPFEGFESILTEDLYSCLNESDQESLPCSQPFSSPRQDVWSPSSSMDATTSTQSSVLTIPGEAMEIDNQLSIIHLLKAYGEAREKNQTELGDVILRCVSEKSSPVGETWERIAFNLSQDNIRNNQGDNYLMQESSKNFQAAFRAFYQMFPYGRFAHFAANSAILEAMPSDADMLHIVDFDMKQGIQWPPMIEAMAWQRKTLRLTSIRWENEDLGQFTFEETRKQLCDHAKSFGLNLEIEEMGIEDLVNEFQKMRKRGGNNGEWLAFNCMTELLHMGKSKSRNLVNEFLNVAKEVLSSSGTRNRGIITFSDGDACGNLKDCSGFGSFFDGQLMHYQAILESMQSNFPNHLMQARMAMEALFVGPNICCQDWFRKWKEMNEVSCHFQAGIALEGLRVSTERLMEAKEIVRQSESSYEVRTNGGNCGNELALEWRGTTLVRVSSWRN
ncbi:Transcription factor GRAS [Corchorus olitorius]|uniref:Transcription factor GRAS n=1 Tax=Corchorus olitorius TaxID=93759 RepID=A0A1R3JSD7_9ROSI|nr:Transcription factor GRAS [Corchorus olitorius]